MEFVEPIPVRDRLGRIRYPVVLPSRGGLVVFAKTPIQARILSSCEAIIALAGGKTDEPPTKPATPPRRAGTRFGWDWSRWPWTAPRT